jgi:hypothetical protein
MSSMGPSIDSGKEQNEWYGKHIGELAVMMCKMKLQFSE